MKRSLLTIIMLFAAIVCVAQAHYRKAVKPVKNVIVMIPDGTAMSVVTAARWYNIYNDSKNDLLAVDPYLCGVVKTYCSNAPIGDSAPTTSCYMTGMPQQAGNISTYPVADPANDLVKVDPAKAYQPLVTIPEALKITKGKAVGLVATCEFPHATPADCISHYYDRNNYKYLAPQFAYNDLDVLFAGGTRNVSDDMRARLQSKGAALVMDDLAAFRALGKEDKAWAVFCDREFPYDIDRDTTKLPSLAEMTRKSLEILSKDPDGFFLMVEGSLIDWAAHGNDAVGLVTEYLAFDEAVAEVMKFALKDGQTAVIVLPDHSNSGFSIGNRNSSSGYANKTLEQLFGGITKWRCTPGQLERILQDTWPKNINSVFKQYTGIELTEREYMQIYGSKNYLRGEARHGDVNYQTLLENIKSIADKRENYFGFTTGGHTGEDVFLAAYHPAGDIPTGMNTNIEINRYLFDVAGLQTPLDEMTADIFAKHTDVFTGMEYTVDRVDGFPVLTVTRGKNKLVVPAFKSVAYLNGKQVELGSVTVYVDKNKTFYLPSKLKSLL